MLNQTHSFSIENTINPNTKEPFGPKYGGTFSIRRATFHDKSMVAKREAAERNLFGSVDPGQMPTGLELGNYYFIFVSTVATEELPKWFDPKKWFDEDDEAALYAVWQEVDRFHKSFRPRPDTGSGEGGSKQARILVQAEVQPSA